MNDSMPMLLDRKVIYESDWVSLYCDRVRMPDGRELDSYHRLHYPHESVSVVIVNERSEGDTHHGGCGNCGGDE